jgi:hypothetical protein
VVFTANHEADDFAVHGTFAVTASNFPLAASAVKVRDSAPSTSVTVLPSCVTVNVRASPPPLTVMVPVREPAPVFAATAYSMFPFPLPLAVFTVSHDALDFAVHDTVAVTSSNFPFAASAVKVRSLAAKAKET